MGRETLSEAALPASAPEPRAEASHARRLASLVLAREEVLANLQAVVGRVRLAEEKVRGAGGNTEGRLVSDLPRAPPSARLYQEAAMQREKQELVRHATARFHSIYKYIYK